MSEVCEDIKYLEEQFDCKIVHFIPVMWSGWELDERMFVALKDEKKILLTSDHGSWGIEADENVINVLERKLSEYEPCVRLTKEAIEIFTQN